MRLQHISRIEDFRKWKSIPTWLVIVTFLWLTSAGCARLRVVEKETYDPATDTYTYKYKKLPEWSEYALGTLAGAVWGLVTLSMFLPSKPKPQAKRTQEKRNEEQIKREKADAKVMSMFEDTLKAKNKHSSK